MKIFLHFLLVCLTSILFGGLLYVGCVVWPLQMLPPTGLIAAIGGGLSWAGMLAVFLHSRSGTSGTE